MTETGSIPLIFPDEASPSHYFLPSHIVDDDTRTMITVGLDFEGDNWLHQYFGQSLLGSLNLVVGFYQN